MSGFPHPVPSGRVTCPIDGPPRLDVFDTPLVPGKKQVACSGGWDKGLQHELNRLLSAVPPGCMAHGPRLPHWGKGGVYGASVNRGGGKHIGPGRLGPQRGMSL